MPDSATDSKKIHGFVRTRLEQLPERNATVVFYRHEKTGARLLSVQNDDENKVFGISFRTPPTDDTGIAHIMEHSVLCGSEQFPVKDPFVQLMKGSLNTFLNAMTFSDKTTYPVASQNRQDFFNLVEVYLDAVFFPSLSPEVLGQEGWHLEVDEGREELSYKGVVFNEMKGAFSSPEGLLYRYSQSSLYPGSSYGHESGGDPRAIPDLTWEQFERFHRRHYHPSNAYIWFYGDDHGDERLELCARYLDRFDGASEQPVITPPEPIEQPLRLEEPYPASPDDTKHFVTVNWLLDDIVGDPERYLAWRVLDEALLGTPASPLHKALIDSGLGADVTGVGLDDDVRWAYFSTGLKGVAPEDVDRVQELVLGTLAELANEGLQPSTVAAALNTIEFRLREHNTGRYPQGLWLMIQALRTWLHDGDPLEVVGFDAPLQGLKKRLEQPGYLEDLIRCHLLHNDHRTTLVLKPDPELSKRLKDEEAERLRAIREDLDDEQLEEVAERARKLKELQETPDPPEALATLPSLALDDLDPKVQTIPIEESKLEGATLLSHDLFTNGVVYLDIALDLHQLPARLLPYLELFSRALLETGTQQRSFVELTEWIGQKTGGIRTSTIVRYPHEQGRSVARLVVRGKAVSGSIPELLAILEEVLSSARLNDVKRLQQVVLDEKSSLEAYLIPGGSRIAMQRLSQRFNEAGWLNEQTGGVSQLFFLRQLEGKLESAPGEVVADLEEIRRRLLTRRSMVVNVTAERADLDRIREPLQKFLRALPDAEPELLEWEPGDVPTGAEGLTIPAQVHYVAQGLRLFDHGYEMHGSLHVIYSYINTAWLWEKVRVQGGAYGGYSSFDRLSGSFYLASYRDPNLEETLSIYSRTADFLRQASIDDDELTRSIIGAIGKLDRYRLPDARGYVSMVRYLCGTTDEERQQYRDEVLGTTVDDFRRFAEVLDALQETDDIVVVGHPDNLARVEDELKLDIVKVK